MAIEDLLHALALRANDERARLTNPLIATGQLNELARMDMERKNREYLRADAKQRVMAADAARVAGVLEAERDAVLRRNSFGYGFNAGIGEGEIGELPPEYDPDQLKEGLTAGRLIKGARDDSKRRTAKAARDKEKADLLSKLSGFLGETGGDPRPILKDPAKLSMFDAPTQMRMRKFGGMLDEDEAGVAGDAGLAAFNSTILGIEDLDTLLSTPLPAGVTDIDKAEALRNRRAATLLAKGRSDLAEEKWVATQKKWKDDDEYRKRMEEKGDIKGVLSSLATEIDDLKGLISLGRDSLTGRAKNPNKEATLTARLEQKMKEYADKAGTVGTPAPGNPLKDPRFVEPPSVDINKTTPSTDPFPELKRLMDAGRAAKAAGNEEEWKRLKADFDALLAPLSPEETDKMVKRLKGE